jgi:hypothetical protein
MVGDIVYGMGGSAIWELLEVCLIDQYCLARRFSGVEFGNWHIDKVDHSGPFA